MKIITPAVIEPAQIISTTAVETNPTWDAVTTYNLDQIVIEGTRSYKSLVNSNLNRQPSLNPLQWQRVGSSNQFGMFDNDPNTPTVAGEEVIDCQFFGQLNLLPLPLFDGGYYGGVEDPYVEAGYVDAGYVEAGTNPFVDPLPIIDGGLVGSGDLTVVVQPSKFNSIVIVNTIADSATVQVQEGLGGPITYEQTVILNAANTGVSDWSQYFFNEVEAPKNQAYLENIPGSGNSVVTLNFFGTSQVSVGQVIFGDLVQIGKTQYGAQAGIIDYSRKVTDEFGNTSFVRRAFSKRLECQVFVDRKDVNRVQTLLSNLRATPVFWIATDDPDYSVPMVIYGFYRDFNTTIAYPSVSLCNLQIEGLA